MRRFSITRTVMTRSTQLTFAVALFITCGLTALVRTTHPFIPSSEHAQSLVITDRNGTPLREMLNPQEGATRWIALSAISPHLLRATILAEDARFYAHHGIDPRAVVRAVLSNLSAGRIVAGGSTITQQLARLMYPHRRTLIGKLYEAGMALSIECALSKHEILEQYLNRAPYGNQVFGIESAAQRYFNKPARDLAIAEATFLAVIPRAPTAFNPYRHPEKTERLIAALLEKLEATGTIAPDDYAWARAHPARPEPRRWHFEAPHFVEMLERLPSHGSVRTALDLGIQRRVEDIIDAGLAPLGPRHVTNAAAVVVANATGEVRALVGSRDYFDASIDGNVNGATARRQPGSTLKPFTYAVALESGFTPASLIPDIELTFPAPEGEYAPQNYDEKFRGPVRLRMALANSLNVPAVYLTEQLGVEKLLATLSALGFDSLDRDAAYYGLGLTLGNGEVTLMELAAAYATLARGGVYMPLLLYPHERLRGSRQIIAPATAYLIADILSDNDARRMSFGEDSPLNLPFRVAAKTGTSKNFRDNWTVGFTKEYTVAVWTGNFDGSPMHSVSGITGAAPIFEDIFLMLASRTPQTWFDAPPTIVHREVCPLSGAAPSTACMSRVDEVFVERTEPREECAFHKDIAIDTRTGLIATAACNPRYVRTESFVALPPMYRTWALAHNVRMAPTSVSPHCPRQTAMRDAGRGTRDAEATSSTRTPSPIAITITSPRAGTRYALDHDMPRRLQTIALEAQGDDELTWYIDDNELATTSPPHRASWQIEEGRHTIRISTRDKRESDEVTIQVYR